MALAAYLTRGLFATCLRCLVLSFLDVEVGYSMDLLFLVIDLRKGFLLSSIVC